MTRYGFFSKPSYGIIQGLPIFEAFFEKLRYLSLQESILLQELGPFLNDQCDCWC